MLPIPSLRLVLMLALPVLAQQGLHQVIILSDAFIAGRLFRDHYVADVAGLVTQAFQTTGFDLLAAVQVSADTGAKMAALQAAQANAHYLAWAISSYLVLVTTGSTAMVARFIGASDRPLANRVMHQSLLLAVVLGATASLVGLGGGNAWLIDFLKLRGDAATFTLEYLFPLFVLLIFQAIEAAGIACLVGAGDTRTGFYIMLLIAVVNVPFAWGFAFGLGPLPALGFVGIAIGTALSHTLGGIVILTVLLRGRFGLKISPRLLLPDGDLLRRLLRISIPAGFDSLSVVFGQFWFLSIVNTLDNESIGAHGIALRWEALGYLSGAAFGVAAMTLVGQNLGARRPEMAARSGWLAFALGCGIMTFMAIVFFAFAPWMFRLSTSLQSIVDAGVPVLRLIAFAMPALASTIVFTSALRGAGDTRVPVLFTWIGFFVVRIPLAYFLILPSVRFGSWGELSGAGLGLYGAWLAMSADLMIRGVFFFYRFARGQWKLQTV